MRIAMTVNGRLTPNRQTKFFFDLALHKKKGQPQKPRNRLILPQPRQGREI
jgi:hypothetical protein